MPGTPVQNPRSVLISGASIAGPALAYWLDRHGFAVTVVERASAVRSGGYPIDVRGTAIEVIRRMGLLPQVREAHVASRALSFVDAEGRTIAALPLYDLAGSETADVELPRGELTMLLYGLTKDGPVRYRFNDAIAALADDGAGVSVRFRSGEQQRFDLVIGADGLHSNTRRLVFGPEEPFNHYLGYTFNLFSMPNELGLSREAIIYAEVGRGAGVYAIRDNPELFAFLIFATETPPFGAHPDVEAQIQRTAAVFARGGWQVPRLIEGLRRADDLFFDTVSQIRMPHWSQGRVALVGDAAYAPSFRSGQGTSLALVGAYLLAGELARHDDPTAAFAAYERLARPFVEANQALAIKEEGEDSFLPRTQDELDARNRMLAALRDSGRPPADQGAKARAVHNGLTLPDYAG